MLALQKKRSTLLSSVHTASTDVNDLLEKEWLLANSRGGYASSTVIGCNTRRYHSLLTGTLNPPVNRVLALSNCLETVTIDGCPFDLSTFEFNDCISPDGFTGIKKFYQDSGVHFDINAQGIKLTKSIYLFRDADTVAVIYDFKSLAAPFEFALRPLIALRDFHSLQKSGAGLRADFIDDKLFVNDIASSDARLTIHCPETNFEKDEKWWYNFYYRKDHQRGQGFNEDLFAPGAFKTRIDSPARFVLFANISAPDTPLPKFDLDSELEKLNLHQEKLIAKITEKKLKTLCMAADQFIVKRRPSHSSPDGQRQTTILAGFPWFADWGRDAFIALPGLLLDTQRFDEARSVLTTFASVADKGMIPNRFDDFTNTASYNSVDASLWFINACFAYYNATSDTQTLTEKLLPTIRCIIDSYHDGTRFDTHADSDGLITSGNEDTQLTWMDAKFNGVAFTPRYGKAVEINALWYNALCLLGNFFSDHDPAAADRYSKLAEKVKASFCRLFINESLGYLNDCIFPDGHADASLRPNQIFAVSLTHSPLSPDMQISVVETIEQKLLTPFGLRTLDPADHNYMGRYIGHQNQRDKAYHQGTVWPFLTGPFIEAYLKVNDFSRKSRKKASQFIEPLMNHLTENGCIGSVSEIFDGDLPQNPRGCIAQAWSVAALIHASHLINKK